MKKLAIVLLVLALTMLAVVPAFAAPPVETGPKSTGPGDCNYGVTHAFLARSGLTGSAHIPGQAHTGASGFCEDMPNYN
jgi:hypothetical protein